MNIGSLKKLAGAWFGEHPEESRHVPALMLGQRRYGPASLMLCIPGALPRHMQQLVREVIEVKVPLTHRRKGIATEMMQAVCDEADVNAMALMLVVRQEPEVGAPDAETLELWYESLGFAVVQTQPAILMIRRVRAMVH